MTDGDRPEENIGPHRRRHPDAFADPERQTVAALNDLSHQAERQARDYEENVLKPARSNHAAIDQATRSLRAQVPWQADLQAGMTGSALNSLKASQREMATLRLWRGLQTSSLESIGAHQREMLDAALRSWRGLQADIAKSVSAMAHIDVSRLEIQEGVRLPRFDLPLDSIESLVSDIGASQRELQDAMRLPKVDFPASSIESVMGDIGASQRELQNAIRRARFDLPESIVRGTSAWSVLRPALPNLLAGDLRRLDVDRADDIFELPGVRPSLLADPFLSKCLDDVYLFLSHNRHVSAIDRAHSALHRVLQLLVGEVVSRPTPDHRKVRLLCRFVCEHHPLFVAGRGRAIDPKLSEALLDIVVDLTQLRNNRSLAHPTDDLPSDAVALSIVERALAVIYQLAERHSRSIEWSAHDRHRYN